MFKGITRTVVTLGWVSLFTDMSSELLYPVMPLLLKSIGFSFVGIGILEGISEAVAGIGKIYFGRIADRYQNKKIFVTAGYGLSALSKLGLALVQTTGAVFAFRVSDRIGKGIRTAPRDAILALETKDGNDAAVFGFHRAMDTIGAFFGPLLAVIYLYNHPGDYLPLLWWAAIPGLVAVLLTLWIREKRIARNHQPVSLNLFRVLSGTDIQSKPFFKAVLPFLIFALINSSDVFLLLFAKSKGLTDVQVLLLYVWYNLVYALAAYPIGLVARRIGTRNVIVIGFVCFALTYGGMLLCNNWIEFGAAFLIYGVYAASTESVMKAHINTFIPKAFKAAGMGFLAGWQSLCLLLASVWTGWLWERSGASAPFIISAATAIIIGLWILTTVKQKQTNSSDV